MPTFGRCFTIQKIRKPTGTSKREIHLILLQNYKQGVSLSDIKRKTGLHRTTVIDHLKAMIKTGEIYKEKGKRGRYFLSRLDSNDTAYLLGTDSIRQVFFLRSRHDKIDQNIMQFFLELHSATAELTQTDNMALELFKLSNKIGALIVQYLIMALDRNNRLIDRYYPEIETKTKIDRDTIVKEWVNDCLAHMWGFLLLECRDRINEVAGLQKGFEEKIQNKEKIKREGIFYLDKKAIKLATESFSKIYPNISQEVEMVKNRLAQTD